MTTRKIIRTRQPQGVVGVNPGPSFVWTPAQGNTRNAVGGVEAELLGASGAPLVAPGPHGIYASGGSNRRAMWDGAKIQGGTDYTVLTVVLDDTGRGTKRNPFDGDNVDSYRVFQLELTASNTVGFVSFNTGGSPHFCTGSTATSATEPSVTAARLASNAMSVWLNGKVDGTGTLSGTPASIQTAGAKLSVGAFAQVLIYTHGFGGQIYLCVYFPYALSDAQLSSIRTPADAWGFVFAPRREPIWVGITDAAILGTTPVLSGATWINPTQTTARPRVSITI